LKEILFIYNPIAGTGIIKKSLFEVIDFYNSNKYLVTLCPVEMIEEFENLKDHCYKYERVVCSGGDGTINIVISYFEKSKIKVPIAYIPSGTTNDYAYSLGILGNFHDNLVQSLNGKRRKFDIGQFNEEYFLYVAGFGMFTKVSYSTSQKYKNLLGHMAYILEGIKQLSEIKTYHLRIKCDNEDYEDDFMLGLVTNTISIGGFKTIILENVALDDGLFEVILIVKPKNVLELQEMIMDLINEKIFENNNIIYRKTKHISIKAQEEIEWTLDGEYGGKHTQVVIVNKQKEIEIIV